MKSGRPSHQGIEKLKRKIYERELAKLHEELVLLQKWIVDTGRKVCVVFEGRDGAGKGGHDQGDHGARQPAGLSCRRTDRADRAREDADVLLNATSRTFPRPGRSRSSIAAGTTAQASSG